MPEQTKVQTDKNEILYSGEDAGNNRFGKIITKVTVPKYSSS